MRSLVKKRAELVNAPLSKQQGDLLMDSLTNLSDEVASALAKHQGFLSLRGLIILDDTAARALAQHKNLSVNEDLKDMLATLREPA